MSFQLEPGAQAVTFLPTYVRHCSGAKSQFSSEALWHKPLVSGMSNMGERRGNFCLKQWDRMHEFLCLGLQKSQPPPCDRADPLWERDSGLLQEPSVQEVSVSARAVVVLLGHLSSLLRAYSEGRDGTGMSVLVGSWLIVFAGQDVWGGVCAIPSYPCSQNLCLCVDTVVSVWL